MEQQNNYALQAAQARQRFLGYDQAALQRKLALAGDSQYLYLTVLNRPHRLSRASGSLERLEGERWLDASSFGEIMTVLDYLCDSREDRSLTGRWKNLTSFGLMFHRDLLEGNDPWAQTFQADIPGFRRACRSLGGQEFPQGDAAYVLELFPGVPVVVQLWLGDEEFPANLRFLWDESAVRCIRYETMHYARGLILARLREQMTGASPPEESV